MFGTKKQTGFTIVELLIVIIVIAILALIVITTYNGVQQKARNTKTIAAAEAWIKAIRLYNADRGHWPTASCLGEGYPTGFDGDDSTAQCSHGPTWDTTVSSIFENQVSPYLSGGVLPTPDMQTIGNAGSWRRGIIYSRNVNNPYDLYVIQDNITTCPSLGGATYDSFGVVGSGRVCRYLVQSAS